MKKRTILIIIIAGIVLYAAVWGVAYSYATQKMNNIEREGFIEEAVEYLNSNEEFLSQFGVLIQAKSDDKMPIKNKESANTQYYMDLICTTEKGQFNIRAYNTYTDGWSWSFEQIDNNL